MVNKYNVLDSVVFAGLPKSEVRIVAEKHRDAQEQRTGRAFILKDISPPRPTTDDPALWEVKEVQK